MATPPTSFGKYRILERVAVGTMAEIYKARLDGIGGFHRTFAIKRVLPHLATRSEYVDLLIEEARVAGLLSHANIVQIMDLGEVDGSTFIAMEYVDGPDLGKILAACRQRGISLPVPHAIFIAMEMLKGLEYAHQRQVMKGGRLVPLDVVHRDICPENVLVSRQGEVKVTDFGVARPSTGEGAERSLRYLSPEQAIGEPVDQRADLFSTGVVLFEMLTGVSPFDKGDRARTIDALRSGEHEPASSVNPDVPYGLERIIERTLSRSPADRPASATDMKDALDAFFHEAGFIFTHSTLAAFLKGLEHVPATPTLHPGPDDFIETGREDTETRPIPELSFEDDEVSEARPTRLADEGLDQELAEHGREDDDIDVASLAFEPSGPVPPPRPPPAPVPAPAPARPRSIPDLSQVDTSIRSVPAMFQGAGHGIERASMLDNLQDMSHSVAMGQIAGLGDEATLIRNSPLPGSPTDWSNAATSIRMDPSAGPGESIDDGILLPDPDDWGEAETRIGPAIRELSESPATQVAGVPTQVLPPPPKAPPAPVRSGTSGLQQLLYLLLGAVVTVVVLFVGFFLGMRASNLVPDQSGVPAGTPRIVVEAPINKTVTINDQPIVGPGPHHVAAGVHMVRLLDGDEELSKSRLELREGEHRILSFQLRTVEAPPSE